MIAHARTPFSDKNFQSPYDGGVCWMALEKNLLAIHRPVVSNGDRSFFNRWEGERVICFWKAFNAPLSVAIERGKRGDKKF